MFEAHAPSASCFASVSVSRIIKKGFFFYKFHFLLQPVQILDWLPVTAFSLELLLGAQFLQRFSVVLPDGKTSAG